MATGNYGVVRPADVLVDDIQVFYSFASNRNETPNPLTELDSNTVIDRFQTPNTVGGSLNVFPGLYNLTLPEVNFSQKGYYNIVIRPREITTEITDCGVLSSSPDVKGIVLDVSSLPSNLSVDNALIGYRIEYYNTSNGQKTPNLFRIITSSGRVEPVNQNLTNTSQKGIRYRYKENGNLVFCTLTPTSSANTLPNRLPFIGEPGQTINVTNTFFNPVFLELEMTEYDLETLSYGIYGNQAKSINDGIYTIYDNNNNIYKQYNLFEIQDNFGNPLYEIREDRGDDIDLSKNFNTLTSV
jgi:hypothetical protein